MDHQMKLTVPLEEAAQLLRRAGMRISSAELATGIAAGRYSFGRLIGVGPTGRRRTEIFRVDLLRWIAEKQQLPEPVRQ